MPGDELVSEPSFNATRAITIDARPKRSGRGSCKSATGAPAGTATTCSTMVPAQAQIGSCPAHSPSRRNPAPAAGFRFFAGRTSLSPFVTTVSGMPGMRVACVPRCVPRKLGRSRAENLAHRRARPALLFVPDRCTRLGRLPALVRLLNLPVARFVAAAARRENDEENGSDGNGTPSRQAEARAENEDHCLTPYDFGSQRLRERLLRRSEV